MKDVARLGDLTGTSANTGCLADHIETLLQLEGLAPVMAAQFSEYEEDDRSTGNWRE